MIFNFFTVLAVFVVLWRLLLGIAVCVSGCAGIYRSQSARPTDGSLTAGSLDARYLLLLVIMVLLGLNVLSWPLFLFVLQSYVPHWPGVMCIYGVMQIGRDSTGISRLLPELLAWLQWTKPLLVLASVTWLAVYLVDAMSKTAPLARRVFALAMVLGAITVADGVIEGAYLVIPKQSQTLAVGCCVTATVSETEHSSSRPSTDSASASVANYFIFHLVLVASLLVLVLKVPHVESLGLLIPVCAFASLTVPVTARVLHDVVVPQVLHLQYHRCGYDLLTYAPETSLGVGLHTSGLLSLLSTASLALLARHEETIACRQVVTRRLLFASMTSFAWGGAFFAAQLWIA